MGVVAKTIKQNIEKFIQLVSEPWKGYNRNALLYTAAGDDSVPLKDERLILIKVDGTGKYVAVGVLTPSQGAKPGEKILFARDADGNIMGKFSMLGDGSIITEAEKDRTEKIKGDITVNGEKSATMTIKGDITFEADGKMVQKAKGDAQLETLGKFTIKGAQIQISGDTEIILQTIGSAMWCPNGTTNCYICGAPHGGPAMGIVGLKGA